MAILSSSFTKTIVIFSLFTVAFMSLGCKEELITSHRGTITVDGQNSDWKGVPALSYQEQRASLRISNDDDNLYLLFETGDPQTARMLRFSGITIYLDKTGKKNRNFYVKFKGGSSPAELRGAGGASLAARATRRDSPFESDFDTTTHFTCFEKNNIIEKEIPTNGEEGPAIAYSTGIGGFVYEFRFPLAKSAVRYYGVGTSPGEKIGIGLIWGDRGAFRPDFSGRGFSGAGAPGIGMTGGGGGFGRGRKPGGPGGPARNRGFEKQEVWFKTRLAQAEPLPATN